MLTLPEELRDAFKEPLGPVYADSAALLDAVDDAREEHRAPDAPLVAVGDVVTYHLRRAGRGPDVAVIDGKTEREAVDPEVRRAIERDVEGSDTREGTELALSVENEPATLSAAMLEALATALDAEGPAVVTVVGEEDLAALPAIVAAPPGSSVVYGQPGEGMVHVAVTPEAKREARELFSRLAGDTGAALDALGVDG